MRVPRPAGPLDAAILPALKWGPYTFEGFFDRQGKYFERITRRGRKTVQAWFCLVEVSQAAEEAA
jgi:hypothetical protein